MPGICIVDICDHSIVLPSGSIDVLSFEIVTGAIIVLACFDRCIFSPESVIVSAFLLR